MIKNSDQAAEIDKKSDLTAEEELTILSREAKNNVVILLLNLKSRTPRIC